jgi:hypothetical protein
MEAAKSTAAEAKRGSMATVGRSYHARTHANARIVPYGVRVDAQNGVTTFRIRVQLLSTHVEYKPGYGPQTPHDVDGTLGQHESRHVADFQQQYTTQAFDRNLATAGASISPETGEWQVQGGLQAATAQVEAMRSYYQAYVQWRQDAVIDTYTTAPPPTFQGQRDPWLDFSSLFSAQ